MKRFFTRNKGGGMRGLLCIEGELSAVHIRPNGGLNNRVELGVLQQSKMQRFLNMIREGGMPLPFGMVVTNAGVNFMVDDWDADTLNISDLNFHDSGTGITAAAVGDTNLQTLAGPTTRATGTKSQPSANIIRSVGTITYTGTLAITEWGIFNAAARATVNMWDRKVFSAVNVVATDAIQFTYDLTISSGG